MTLFPIELSRTNELLERIAIALERLAGPVIEPHIPEKKQNAIRKYGQEKDQWNREQIKAMVEDEGLSPKESEELLAQVLGQYGAAIGHLTEDDDIPVFDAYRQ